MATSAVPLLIDALVAQATAALTGKVVSDGLNVSDDYGDFLMVGIEDPDTTGLEFSAETSEDWATVGAGTTSRDEEGEIVCAAWSWTGVHGSAGQKAARDAAYGTLAALAGVLRANPSLGVPQVLWTSFGSSTRLSQIQGAGGSGALLVFRIKFRARL